MFQINRIFTILAATMSGEKKTYSPKNTDFAGDTAFVADYANHQEETNHLGNVLAVVSDRKIAIEDGGNPGTVEYYEADVVSAQDYYPFGMIMPGRSVSAGEYRYGFNGMEQDDEWSVTGGHLDFGARIYDSRLGRWLAVDPAASKYPSFSPYNFAINNPLVFIDPDGREPISSKVGTASDFKTVLDNSPREVGRFTGDEAHQYMQSLGETDFNWRRMRPEPTQTGFFNELDSRYIYTEEGGWVDMVHFMFYAGRAYEYKVDGEEYPVGKAMQDGLLQEVSDIFVAPHSAFSYEDLPSNKHGADFAVDYFDPESDLTFGEQLENFLINELGATDPQNAPNYEDLPDEYPDEPTRINLSTDPVYTEENP